MYSGGKRQAVPLICGEGIEGGGAVVSAGTGNNWGRSKRYGTDVLAPGSPTARKKPGQGPVPEIVAEPGLVVEDSEGRFCGAVVRCDKDAVTLEDRHGNRRV